MKLIDVKIACIQTEQVISICTGGNVVLGALGWVQFIFIYIFISFAKHTLENVQTRK